MSIRVLLCDDHSIVREELRALLAGQRDLEVVAEAGNGMTTVKMAGELSPDVAILDISMPDLNGVEATRQVIAVSPCTKVVALSMHAGWVFVESTLRAGASGYLLKDCAFEELVNAVRAVARGDSYLSPGVAGAGDWEPLGYAAAAGSRG